MQHATIDSTYVPTVLYVIVTVCTLVRTTPTWCTISTMVTDARRPKIRHKKYRWVEHYFGCIATNFGWLTRRQKIVSVLFLFFRDTLEKIQFFKTVNLVKVFGCVRKWPYEPGIPRVFWSSIQAVFSYSFLQIEVAWRTKHFHSLKYIWSCLFGSFSQHQQSPFSPSICTVLRPVIPASSSVHALLIRPFLPTIVPSLSL